MEVKTLKRKWARTYWVFLWGFFLSWFFGVILPNGAKPLCVVTLTVSAAGIIFSILKLRCPYCGKDAPRAPAFSPSSGKVRYCSGCGRPFVYDDEV